MAGALAHEIKNPLSVIRMNMDLLTEDLADEDPINRRRVLQKIQIVQRQCERLQNLLNDFLKFARVRKLDLTPGNLNEQVNARAGSVRGPGPGDARRRRPLSRSGSAEHPAGRADAGGVAW